MKTRKEKSIKVIMTPIELITIDSLWKPSEKLSTKIIDFLKEHYASNKLKKFNYNVSYNDTNDDNLYEIIIDINFVYEKIEKTNLLNIKNNAYKVPCHKCKGLGYLTFVMGPKDIDQDCPHCIKGYRYISYKQ